MSLGWAAVWLAPDALAPDLTAISPGAVGASRAYFWLHRSSHSGGSVSLSSPLGVPYGRARWPSSYPRWQEDKRVSFQLSAAGHRAAAITGSPSCARRGAWIQTTGGRST